MEARRRSRSPGEEQHRRHRHHRHHRRDDYDGGDHDDRRKRRKRSHSPLLDPTVNPYPRQTVLPYSAKPLSRHGDFEVYRHLFASYLDIQKQKYLDELDEREAKGRWKSFVNKWNHGELAQGWYDPETRRKADEAAAAEFEGDYPPASRQEPRQDKAGSEDDDDDDDDYGPSLPSGRRTAASGPSAATAHDLVLRNEMIAEDVAADRKELRHLRKMDRNQQKERLDEILPRAEAGTRERQLEKKREKADAVRAFKDAKGEAGDMAEVGEGELMGEGGGVDEYKRIQQAQQRRKNERQIKKEEALRARAVEREERMQGLKAREDQTMDMLKAIAKERFG